MLSQEQLVRLLESVAHDVIARAEELRELDAALGDGDLGVTVRAGFEAVVATLHKEPGPQSANLQTLLGACGAAFMNANASTMGTLMGTAFLRAGKAAGPKTEIGSLAEAAAMFRAAAEGIQQRGKAQRGDKTILDALFPAVEALEAAAGAGEAPAAAFAKAADAAQRGVDETTPLQSRVSRASWLQERSKGRPDPGATLAAMVFRSLAARVGELG